MLKLKRQAARLGFQAFPQLSRAALAIVASRLTPAAEPQFFSRDLREMPAKLNEELLDLYGRSEQVLANLFVFHNIAEALERDFDWEMHESAAWRSELHSFDYALSLAMTYRISQEMRYARRLRYLISHWIAMNPPESSTGWEPGPLARRVRNWILARDLAMPAWQDDAEFHGVFQQSLAMQCIVLPGHAARADSIVSSLHCARALLLASRVFGKSAEEFAATGRSLLASAAGSIFECSDDGELPRPTELYELAEAYLEHVIFTPPAEDAARAFDVETTCKILTLLEGSLAPDGTLPMLGPAARSRADELSDLYALAAVVFSRPRWKNLAGKFGILPYLLLGERGNLQFERMAKAPWNSGWRAVPELGLLRLGNENRSALIINARPVSNHRDHQDFLSYELYVEGLRVVVDSGPYSPEGEDWSKYFFRAQAHNVLLIDGSSPRAGVSVSRTKMRGEWNRPSTLPELAPGPSFCNEGFAYLGVYHRRAFFILDGEAWAVVDWLTGEGRHRMMSLIHFFPTFEVELLGDRAVARSRALSVTIFPLVLPLMPGPSEAILQTWRGPGTKNQGFYSPDFGVKFPSAVLAVSANEIKLPWIGGYVIARGTGQKLLSLEMDPAQGRLAFELSRKTFRLGFD